MFRLRLAILAVAAGLGLVCGCVSLSQFPLLERLRARRAADCCDNAIVSENEGPAVDGPAFNGAMTGGPGIGPVPSITPPDTMLPLAPPPRIVPQPLAQPAPYTP